MRHHGRHRLAPLGELANAIPAPFPASNRCVVSSWPLPRLFPGHLRRWLAEFWQKQPRPKAKGHIAGLLFFLGCFVQSRVLFVKDRKVETSIVNLFWLILVKNCRKIRKMQTQFCWTPGEKYYNFC
jgi:hypothetical protein